MAPSQSEQKAIYAAAANGHLWAEPIVFQVVCRLCGHVARWEAAKTQTVPACTWGKSKEPNAY